MPVANENFKNETTVTEPAQDPKKVRDDDDIIAKSTNPIPYRKPVRREEAKNSVKRRMNVIWRNGLHTNIHLGDGFLLLSNDN